MLDFQILFNRMNFERSKTPIIQNDRIIIYYLHLFVILFFFILNLHRSVRVTPLLPRKKETHWSALFITFYIYIVTLLRKEQIFINFSAMKQFNIIPF